MSRGGTTYLFDGIFGGTINVTIFTVSKKVSFLLRHCLFTRDLLSMDVVVGVVAGVIVVMQCLL
jgi:hypothetical protein